GINWNYSKIVNRNKVLQKNFNHNRVLFVQHPLEKGRSQTAQSGSFIACAEVLGNCDHATEGGIPRSSRFRWFASVPRVHAGVSEGAKRLSGFYGDKGTS